MVAIGAARGDRLQRIRCRPRRRLRVRCARRLGVRARRRRAGQRAVPHRGAGVGGGLAGRGRSARRGRRAGRVRRHRRRGQPLRDTPRSSPSSPPCSSPACSGSYPRPKAASPRTCGRRAHECAPAPCSDGTCAEASPPDPKRGRSRRVRGLLLGDSRAAPVHRAHRRGGGPPGRRCRGACVVGVRRSGRAASGGEPADLAERGPLGGGVRPTRGVGSARLRLLTATKPSDAELDGQHRDGHARGPGGSLRDMAAARLGPVRASRGHADEPARP